ncbi:carbohydrate binding family 9 domain-containing protein [candidate division KSB1 bacterium]|nr:carbohydrate binding family 9 domain-containing protein [candidate division KSB1 bacterium]
MSHLKRLLRLMWILQISLIFASHVFGKAIEAHRTDHPPVIDGIVSSGEWNCSDSARHFIQMEPSKGMPASESTTVFVQFDSKKIYYAFKCYDSTPNTIVGAIQIRDQVHKSDDAIMLLIDTYHDHRSAFGFLVNPLGTQTDLRVQDDGRNLDSNWDTQWQAAAERTTWGWCVEIAIPFSSISYKESLKTWGINFARIIRKNAETAYWSGELNEDSRISQGGELTGLQLPGREKTFILTPYSTLRYEDSDQTNNHREWLSDFGADAAYRVTPGLVANLTVNPDFATVEGDQDQINLTRWELSFPEKRLFFLEGNELFSTRIKTFYSRRIGDIDYGGKMSGKIGDYTVSMIGAKTSPANENNPNPSALYSVFCIKKDILKSSTLGIIAVDKSWEGQYSRSISADYVLNLGRSWRLNGQFVTSAPGSFRKHSAWYLRFARESNYYHYHIRYSDTGEQFRENVNHTGFVRDDDMREIDSDVTYTWWPKNSFMKYIHAESRNNIFWNHQRTLRSWYVTESLRFYLKNRLSLDLAYNDEFKLYEKKFYNHQYNILTGYNTDEWASASVGATWGRNYDRDFELYTVSFRIRPVGNLTLDYAFKRLFYSPDLTRRSTFLNILMVDYNFTRDLWFRILAQNNTVDDRLYFYGLFAWRFQPPFGAMYLIYTTDEFEPVNTFSPQKNRIFFLKLAYQIGI